MKKLLLAVFTTGFLTTLSQAALPVQMTFTRAKSGRAWSQAELNAKHPAGWTPCEFLVVEFKAASSQRFDPGLETPNGRFAKIIGSFAGVWVRSGDSAAF